MKTLKNTMPCRFGFLPEGDQHHFCVIIPKSKYEFVTIEERFLVPDPNKPLTKDKRAQVVSKLNSVTWELISNHFLRNFKVRVPKKISQFHSFESGENWIPRLLGKELCVLAWAVENATEAQLHLALDRWSNLAPETRWWLFNMVLVSDSAVLRGWKLAIQVALCEKDASDISFDLPNQASFNSTQKIVSQKQ